MHVGVVKVADQRVDVPDRNVPTKKGGPTPK